ncbi:MAG: MATE family efflux transporter [Rhodospirillaceae bacterium]|nr:MATE family efflux transporter [Rhodospirillaceae bacterium]
MSETAPESVTIPASRAGRRPPGAGRGGVRLTEGPVSKQILKLSRYLMMGSLATMSFQVADAYFVAQLGTKELAALAFTFPMVMILHAIAIGLGSGVTSVVARAVGEGDHHAARVLTTDSLTLSLAIALFFAVAGLSFMADVFALMGAPADVLVHINAYMNIWFYGMPLMIVPLIANAVIRAYGDAKSPSLIMGGAAVLNIFLDPIFIFGAWFVPGMGLKGAAIALLISRSVTFVLSLAMLHYRVHALTYEWPSLTRSWDSWRKLMHIGLPATGTQLIQPVSSAILTTLVASYGATAVAAYGISTRIEMFSMIFIMSLSIAMAPFVGQNAGAGKVERVREALHFSYKASILYGLGVALLLLVAGRFLASEFSDEPAVITLAAFYLMTVPVSYGVLGVINTSSSALNSLAKPMPAMMIGTSKTLLVQIPCAYAGSIFFGINGVFLGMALSTFIVAAMAFVLTRRALGELAPPVLAKPSPAE